MKPSLALPLLLLVAWTAGDAPAADWSGATADQMISFDDNEYARAVQLILDEGSGVLHAFWSEDAPSVRELHYGRSTDLGETWSCAASDRIISFPDGKAFFEEQDVDLTHLGTIVVVWSEDVDATREVHYGISADGGATFSCETQDLVLSDLSTAVDTGVPSVAVDGNLAYHVVWQQVVGGVAEVHYSRSTDGGATWSGTSGDRIISFPDGNGAITPKIMVGEGDRLIVVWRENGDAGTPVIHVGISDDGGDTWSSEVADREISQPVRLMTDLAAAAIPYWAGPDGNLHVVYAASFDEASPFHYEVYATSSTDNGDTWTGETVTTAVSHDEDHTRSAHNPDVFASACSGVIAAWDEEEDVAGTNEQHVSIFDGVSWSGAAADEIISFPDGEDGYRPSVVGAQGIAAPPLAGRGEASDTWVAWTEFAGDATDNYEVHVSGARLCAVDAVPPMHPGDRLRLRAVPNPSRSAVELRLETPFDGGAVVVEVFDVDGRRVRRLAGETDAGGAARIAWDARDARGWRVPMGVYWARAEFPGGVEIVRIVLK
jgi:hypothetical protein